MSEPEFREEYYTTKSEARKVLHDLREQAADISEMSLDEINAEITVAREE